MLSCPECGTHLRDRQAAYWHLKLQHSFAHAEAFDAAGTAEPVATVAVQVREDRASVFWNKEDGAGRAASRAMARADRELKGKARANWAGTMERAAVTAVKKQGGVSRVSVASGGVRGAYHVESAVLPADAPDSGKGEARRAVPASVVAAREKQRNRVVLMGATSWLAKDQAKSDMATKFIGRGSPASSTARYARSWGARANCGKYSADDVVFVSAEGGRKGRLAPDWRELETAVAARVAFVTDKPEDRQRLYNSGEREVAVFLLKRGYGETRPGFWEAGKAQPEPDGSLKGAEVKYDAGVAAGGGRKAVLVNRRYANTEYDVYVGRPSKWGNPFEIGKDGTREEVVAKYEAWIVKQPHLMGCLHELKGKRVACWCAPEKCHGEILVRLANELPEGPSLQFVPRKKVYWGGTGSGSNPNENEFRGKL